MSQCANLAAIYFSPLLTFTLVKHQVNMQHNYYDDEGPPRKGDFSRVCGEYSNRSSHRDNRSQQQHIQFPLPPSM